MKFFKLLGWCTVGLVFLTGLAYGLLPTIASRVITQELTDRGFTNVGITIDRPGTHILTIPSLAFHTPPESGSHSLVINNAEITYSLHSLLNRAVDAINIEHIRIEWNTSVRDRPATSLPSVPTQQTKPPFPLKVFGPKGMLLVLPFQHFRVKHLDISNPLAPPAFKQISLNTKIDALQGGYEGSVHIEGEELLLNHLTFSLTQDGSVSFAGFHTNAPEDSAFALKTSLRRSASSLKLQGKATLKLHPVIHTLTALYPLAPDYQSVTGTFSGTWAGLVHEQPSQTGSFLGPIKGDFTLDAHMPRWPLFAQDIQILTHGTFSMEESAITLILQPSSIGNVNLSLHSLIPPALTPFISHKGLRSFAWNIQQPVHAIVPNTFNLADIQFPSGTIQMAMNNTSEKVDLSFSPKNLHWQQSSGIEGQADMSISTHFKPAATPSLKFEEIFLKADVSLTFLPDQIKLAVNPPSLLHLANVRNASIHIPALKGLFPKELSWTFYTNSHTWELHAEASTLTLPSFSFQGQQWKVGEIFAKDFVMISTPHKWAIEGETTIQQVRSLSNSFKIPVSNWQVRYSVNPISAIILFNGQTLEHPLYVGGQARLSFLTGEGSGAMALKPIRFAPQTLVLSQLIQPWPFPDMEVTHGTISASAEASFERISTNSDESFHLKHLHGIVDFNKIGGFFKPTILQGLTTRIEILGEDDTLRIPRTPLRITNVQSAVELTETALLFSTGAFHQSSVPTSFHHQCSHSSSWREGFFCRHNH